MVFESKLKFTAYVMFRVGGLGMESVVAVLSSYEENTKWLCRHYEELKEKFKDEWVAVLDKRVVDPNHDLSMLVKRLRSKYPEAYNKIAIEYVTTKEIELIL